MRSKLTRGLKGPCHQDQTTSTSRYIAWPCVQKCSVTTHSKWNAPNYPTTQDVVAKYILRGEKWWDLRNSGKFLWIFHKLNEEKSIEQINPYKWLSIWNINMLSSVQKSKIKQNKSLQWTELKHCEKQGEKKRRKWWLFSNHSNIHLPYKE